MASNRKIFAPCMALAAMATAIAAEAIPPAKGVASIGWTKDSALVVVDDADAIAALPAGDFWIGVRAKDETSAVRAAKKAEETGLAERAFVVADAA